MLSIITENGWIFLVLLYGIFKGIRECVKKKALQKNGTVEVLFFYTLFGFILVIPSCNDVFSMPKSYILPIFIKSAFVFTAWICAFRAIKKIPISLYGITDMSRVLFSTTLGVVVLHETMGLNQFIGLALVILGVLMVNLKKRGSNEGTSKKYFIFIMISCICNATSGVMDKVLMKTGDITHGQLQFWYMLFLTLMYLCYLIFTRTKVNIKSIAKNYWIWILSILFVIADRALFAANGYEASKVTVMTLIKQSSVIVTILLGRLVFKEKNILYKIICAVIVATGIVIASL